MPESRGARASRATTAMRQISANLWANGDYTNSDNLLRATSTMLGVLRESGFKCSCKIKDTVRGQREVCECRATLKGRGDLLGGFFMDGKRCRDGSGAFVPVSQCKGKVGRDAAGRFVSVK